MPKILMEFEIDAELTEADAEGISESIAEFANEQMDCSWCMMLNDHDYERHADKDEELLSIQTKSIDGCEFHNLNGGI